MTAIPGKDAIVKVGANTVLDVDTWSMTPVLDMLDETEFGDEDRMFIAGLAGQTGVVSGNLNMGDTNGQLALFNAHRNKTTVTINLFDDATSFFQATAFVTGFDVVAGVADKITVSITLQFTGGVTFTP